MTDNNRLPTDRLRARTLRWLLKLTKADDLPMPARIEFGQRVSPVTGETLRYLVLGLDDENTDLTAWAKAINAEDIEELKVTGETHTWTSARARTAWTYEPRVDWHSIEVTTRYGYQPHRGRRS